MSLPVRHSQLSSWCASGDYLVCESPLLLMSSRVRLLVGGGVTYIAAVAVGYSYSISRKPPGCHHGEVKLSDADRQQLYAQNAKAYDSEIGMDEFFMGLNLIRWWYIRKATGNVLEVGCGTGRNFGYYNLSNVQHVTAVDSVPNMVQVASVKIPNRTKMTVQQMNAHELRYPDDHFDTVVDTFGLCSYEDPVKVLKEIARVCKPSGKILLIEHGKGLYDWINNILDNSAQQHANKWGCIYNKDIHKLVVDAGLEIVKESRFHFGTTYVIQAKSSSSSASSSTGSSNPVSKP